jgi:hypothetical protein
VSFNLDRLIGRGKLKRLHELLTIKYHLDPDPSGRARVDLERLLTHAFDNLATHYKGVKGGALDALIRLQGEALDFYGHVLRTRGKPDVAKLERILADMDAEMAKLTRTADQVAGTAPRLDLPPIGASHHKAWDDPTLTFDEFKAQYKARNPTSTMREDALKAAFDADRRVNPETGDLKQPVAPKSPPAHVELTTDPARIEAWKNYERGGARPPCFPAGTLVHGVDGTERIERITAGVTVLAWDERSGAVVPREVVRVFENWTDTLVEVQTSTEVLHTTRGHRFWVEDRRAWVAAAALQAGMVLRTREGTASLVVRCAEVLAHEATYNLEVAEYHTYCVAHAGLIVHNENDSKWSFRDAERILIYEVRDAAGTVIYVGQTNKTTVEARLKEHLNDQGSVLCVREPGGPPIQLTDPDNIYSIKEVGRGDWTPYEAAVWEQHHIDRNGGKAKLLNRVDAITPDQATTYRNFHNPC